MRTYTEEQVGKIREALVKGKRSHYYCDDSWYSCPRAVDGCSDESKGDECDCGADEVNTVLDAALSLLNAPEAEGWRPIETAPKDGTEVWLWGYRSTEGPDPEQKPGRYIGRWHGNGWSNTRHGIHPDLWQPLPQPPHSKHDGGE